MNRFIVDYNYYNNQRFSKEVEEKIKTKEVLMNGHTGKYAAKIHNEEELELIKNYWKTALASCQGTVIIENGDFRGPDWYFIYIINEFRYVSTYSSFITQIAQIILEFSIISTSNYCGARQVELLKFTFRWMTLIIITCHCTEQTEIRSIQSTSNSQFCDIELIFVRY